MKEKTGVKVEQSFKRLYEKYKIYLWSTLFALFILLVLTKPGRYFIKYHLLDPLQGTSKHYFEAGIKYAEEGYTKYAIGSFSRAINYRNSKFSINRNDPYQIESVYNLAALFLKEKREVEAFNLLKTYINLVPPETIEKNQNKRNIYELLNYFLEKDDKSRKPEARKYKKLGNEFFFKRKYKEAIKFYTKALEIDPMYEEVYYNRASAYMMINDFENAVNDWEAVYMFRGGNVETAILINLALAYDTKLNKPEKALRYYQEVLKRFKPGTPQYNETKRRIEYIKARLGL